MLYSRFLKSTQKAVGHSPNCCSNERIFCLLETEINTITELLIAESKRLWRAHSSLRSRQKRAGKTSVRVRGWGGLLQSVFSICQGHGTDELTELWPHAQDLHKMEEAKIPVGV